MLSDSDHLGDIATQPPDYTTDYQSGELFGIIKDDPEPLAGAVDLLTFELQGISSTFRVVGPSALIAGVMKAAAGQRWKLAGLFARGRGGRNTLRIGGTYYFAQQIINNTDSERREAQTNFRSWESTVMNRDLSQLWPRVSENE